MARSLVERLKRQRIWSTEFRCWTLSEQGTLNSEQPYEARREKLEEVRNAAAELLDFLDQGLSPTSLHVTRQLLRIALAAVPEIPEE